VAWQLSTEGEGLPMPKVSKASAKNVKDHGPVYDCADELMGYAVNFVEFRQDIDGSPLLKGLPDDRCQCPHWGYVVKGKMSLRFPDRVETFEAGDAYYAPPGHAPIKHEPGTQIVQFSPVKELRETEAVLLKNLQAMQAARS
jgi:glyoxylate utilization-related uncharacterized protein